MARRYLLPRTRAWLEQSALAPHLPRYCAYLNTHQYAPGTQRNYICCIAHFSNWMRQKRLTLSQVDEDQVERYLSEYLPGWDCAERVPRAHKHRAALGHLLRTLRASGAIAPRRKVHEQTAAELNQFDAYMRQVGGFADTTRALRVRTVRRLLSGEHGSRSLAPVRLSPSSVRRFIGKQRHKCRPDTMHNVIVVLRNYLRFRASKGDEVHALLAAIPSLPRSRRATVPEVPSDSQIERLLKSFDHPFPSSRRAYAILRCLVDLGLRSSEVANLGLDDIDWQAGTIRLTKSKSRRVDVLPLPRETGRAIIQYLVSERPQTASRAVFVRHIAPHDKPITNNVIADTVRAAYRRCGLSHTRVHILRHSIASRLLRAGTPLKEIADLLRHRSLNTTAVYTRVDVNRLAAVALPWPGSAR